MNRQLLLKTAKRHKYLLAVLVASFLLMVFGSWRVAPHQTIPDETGAIERALTIGYERNPFLDTFKKGGNLHLYLLAVSFVPVVVGWLLTGRFGDITSQAADLGPNPGWDAPPELLRAFYEVMLAGRLASVVFGTATVLLVYLVARELADDRAGLAAATVLTLCAGYVLEAHYATEDVPQTFFMMLTLVLLLYARRMDSRRYLFGAAVATGFAISAKATSGLLLVPLTVVIVEHHRDAVTTPLSFLRRTVAYPIVAFAGYVATTPSVLRYPGLWVSEVQRYLLEAEESSASAADPVPLLTLESVFQAYGFALAVVVLVATVAVAVRLFRNGFDDPVWIPLSVAVPYYVVLGFGWGVQYRRIIYLLPLLAVFGGVALSEGYRAVRDRPVARPALLAGLALVVAFSAVYAGAGVADFATSRAAATEWNEDHFEAGTEIDVHSQRVYLPEFPADATVNRYVVHEQFPEDQWQEGVARLQGDCPEYVVMSSYHYARFFDESTFYPSEFPDATAEFERLLEEDGYEIVRTFGPDRDYTHQDPLLVRTVRRSTTFQSYPSDNNPKIVVLERTTGPASSCE